MKLPVLTAVVDPRWEATLVSAFESGGHGVTVVRRCVDLADLLAVAATGVAQAVVVSADLRRLDREALARLTSCGLTVVGLVPPGDEGADRRLRQLGVRWVLGGDAAPEVVAQALAEAVATADGLADVVHLDQAFSVPMAGLPSQPPPAPVATAEVVPGTGRLVAVWGPAGAPGRSTVAVNLAAELAGLDVPTLLIDADVYGGVMAAHLGLLEEAPGLPAACRSANAGSLDVAGLAALARSVNPRLRVLTGIARADRWPELRPSAMEPVLGLARSLARFVVADCGFCLEQDEELSFDTAAPRRNGATLAVLAQADTILAVVSADPIGLQRFVRGIAELREAVPGVEPVVVVNRVRKSAVGRDPEQVVREALSRYAGIDRAVVLPYDLDAVDRAMQVGRTLAEAAPGSSLRTAIRRLAGELAGVPVQRKSWARRGRAAAAVGE